MLSKRLLAKIRQYCPPLRAVLEARGQEPLEREILPILLLLAAARAPVSRLQLRRWAQDSEAVERVLENRPGRGRRSTRPVNCARP